MPGIIDHNTNETDFLTPFRVFGGVISSDQTLPGVEDFIDLRASVTATRNKVYAVITAASAGATAKVSLYVRPASGSLADKWLLLDEANTAVDSVVKFENLYAGVYRLVVTDVTSGPVQLHVSHADAKGQSDLGEYED